MLSTPAKYLQKIDTMFGKSGEKPAASRVSEGLEGLSGFEERSRQDSQDEGSQEGNGDGDGSVASSLEAESIKAIPRRKRRPKGRGLSDAMGFVLMDFTPPPSSGENCWPKVKICAGS